MKKVAKLVLIDQDNTYLLLYRSNHPTFGNDPDLPGGTQEGNETMSETVLREVKEEIGAEVKSDDLTEVYSGTAYSGHGTQYVLFLATIRERPDIVLSWEHSKYDWLSQEEFLQKARNATDSYLHMVADTLGVS